MEKFTSWVDCYNKFIEIADDPEITKLGIGTKEYEDAVFEAVEKLYKEHQGEACWDEAWDRYTDYEYSPATINNIDEAFENLLQLDEAYGDDHKRYEKISSKVVIDFDGFTTEYTLYKDLDTDVYFTIFGDTDLYTPENSEPDFETENKEEALEWFNSYEGYVDHDDDNIDLLVNDDPDAEIIPRIPDINFNSLSDLTAFEDPDKYDGVSVTYKKYNEEPKTEIVYDSKSDLENVLSNNKYVEWYKFNDKNVNEDFENKTFNSLQEVRDWMYDHEEALEDLLNFYKVDRIEKLSKDEIIDWISDQDQLFNDYLNHFKVESLKEDYTTNINADKIYEWIRQHKEVMEDCLSYYDSNNIESIEPIDIIDYIYNETRQFYKLLKKDLPEECEEYESWLHDNINDTWNTLNNSTNESLNESLKESIDLSLYPNGYVELIDNEPAFIYDKLSDAQNGVYWDKAYDANETGHKREYKIMRWEDGELKELDK